MVARLRYFTVALLECEFLHSKKSYSCCAIAIMGRVVCTGGRRRNGAGGTRSIPARGTEKNEDRFLWPSVNTPASLLALPRALVQAASAFAMATFEDIPDAVLDIICKDPVWKFVCSATGKHATKAPYQVGDLTTAAQVDWALDMGCPPQKGFRGTLCSTLARHGNLAALKRARELACVWNGYTCACAARGGHLEVLKWARDQGCPWDTQTCACAALGGHLEVLKWARDKRCPWNEMTCARAARGGHLEVLKWARDKGCPWDAQTCANAARCGHLEVLKWARDAGCPWDWHTCANAARYGHLEVLKWAHYQGCPWSRRTCAYAARGGHLEVLKWAHEAGCPWDESMG